MSTRRCTEFCSSSCDGEHHVILSALVKIHNKESLDHFRQLLRAYHIHGFRLDICVPDPHPDFRYPLLHWAVVLGKTDVVKFLLKSPFNVDPTMKSDDGETALHRLLNMMDDGKAELGRLMEMVNLLQVCLRCIDAEKKTPLHLCADILASCQKKELKVWKKVFNRMLDVIMKQKFDVLNLPDESGDTVLHTLSKREDLLDLVEYFIRIGGDFDIVNKAGETPVEVSWRFSLPTYNLYQLLKAAAVDESETGEESEYSISENDMVAAGGSGEPPTTRTSLRLSETKDYTQFFDDQEDCESDEEMRETENICTAKRQQNNRRSLKRKISEMNTSLTNCLEEHLSSSTSSSLHNKTKQRTVCRGRSRKRQRILSETSDSDHEYKNSRRRGKNRGKESLQNNNQEKDESTMKEDSKESTNKARGIDDFESVREELKAIGVELEATSSSSQGEIENVSEEKLQERITNTIRGIRELFEDESDDGDSNCYDGEDDESFDEEFDRMKDKEKVLDRRINILKNAIAKLTSLS